MEYTNYISGNLALVEADECIYVEICPITTNVRVWIAGQSQRVQNGEKLMHDLAVYYAITDKQRFVSISADIEQTLRNVADIINAAFLDSERITENDDDDDFCADEYYAAVEKTFETVAACFKQEM